MRLCVFGAGAVGGHLAAKLAASGHEVSVVARGAHLAAMQENGVKLLHGGRTIVGRVRAAADAAGLGVQEAVLVTLKANMLDAFAGQCAPLLGPDTAVVFVQNGIPWWYDERLTRLDPGGKLHGSVPGKSVLGGVAYSANEVVAPGVIDNHVPGNNMVVLGEIDNRQTPRVAALRAALEAADVSSPPLFSSWPRPASARAAATVAPLIVHTVEFGRICASLLQIDWRTSSTAGEETSTASSAARSAATRGVWRLSISPITTMLLPGTWL
ncbi:MAG TPA: 2-dehydropantoate 2-reductase N-terminal domain-containing protein, partial [Burkholderiales bacterium]|nr:2-dehydropantoate 2-reductase N-terminal domain-containing protein [Burkholderiales bacterium]